VSVLVGRNLHFATPTIIEIHLVLDNYGPEENRRANKRLASISFFESAVPVNLSVRLEPITKYNNRGNGRE
jgi:hypothetical protein